MNRTAKTGLLAAAVVCAIVLVIGYQHRRSVVRWVRRMEHSLAGNRSPAAAPSTLKIGGREFKDVLGYPPYYLAITQYDAVLFVTRVNDGGSNLFHILNLKTGQEEQIKTKSDFGRNIGATGDAFRDYIVSAKPEEIVLASEERVGQPMKTVLHLNLRSALVDTREVYYYDNDGRITNTYVGPGF